MTGAERVFVEGHRECRECGITDEYLPWSAFWTEADLCERCALFARDESSVRALRRQAIAAVLVFGGALALFAWIVL